MLLNEKKQIILNYVFQVQTEQFPNVNVTAIDEKKLMQSLAKLAPIMDMELEQGTTNIFKFRNNQK